MTKRKWDDIETGRRRRLASFISTNNTYNKVIIRFLMPSEFYFVAEIINQFIMILGSILLPS